MKLTKRQINKIKSALKDAVKAENRMAGAIDYLNSVIVDNTGIDGNVDFLQGDGFGFTPAINGDVHICVSTLIELASSKHDITEQFICDNLTF